MRILIALTYYAPHWTGLTAVAQAVAEGMAARGHAVTVLTSRFRSELPTEEDLNGVHVVRLPALMRISRGMVMPAFPSTARRLAAEHDVVQIHTPMLEAALLTRIAHQAGARAVITHHGDLVMPARPFDQFVQMIVTGMLRQAFGRADRAVVYTQDYVDHSAFLRPFAAKCVPVLPPVRIPQPRGSAAWRRELELDGAPIIGFGGRFVEEKGFDFLLRAIPALGSEVPEMRLAYAGEKDVVYEQFYQRCLPLIRRADRAVVWLGLLQDRQRLADFYGMCDVVAVPSRTDNLPLVPIEAMLCGTPVVITDIPGARMAVRLTGMGALVTPRDERALADGILEVLRHRSHYVRPRKEIEAVFNAERSLDEYERALTVWD